MTVLIADGVALEAKGAAMRRIDATACGRVAIESFESCSVPKCATCPVAETRGTLA